MNNIIYNTDISCSIEDKCGVCDGDGLNDGFPCDDIFILQQIIDANDFAIQQSAQNESAFHAWDYNANGIIEMGQALQLLGSVAGPMIFPVSSNCSWGSSTP